MEFLSKTAENTKEIAKSIANKLKPGAVLALYGDLGSGKTTFTRYLAEALEIPARVQSPTFVIARKYHGGIGKIKSLNHIDLYRLSDPAEVEEIGIPEIIKEQNSATVIEWPELATSYVPQNTIKIYFESIECINS